MDDRSKKEFEERINSKRQKRDKSWERYFSPGYAHRKKLIIRFDWIKSQIIGPRVLDVGCGPGVICQLASEIDSVEEVHGLDLQADVLLQAIANVKNDKAHFHHGFAEDIPFGNGYFDTVVLGETLEHVFSAEEAVAETARVLRLGGIAAITVPYRGKLSFAHIRTFDDAYIVKLLKPYFNIMEKIILNKNTPDHMILACVGEKR